MFRIATHLRLLTGDTCPVPQRAPIHIWRTDRGLFVDTFDGGAASVRTLEGDHFAVLAPANCQIMAEHVKQLVALRQGPTQEQHFRS
jgi:hypothetical protein